MSSASSPITCKRICACTFSSLPPIPLAARYISNLCLKRFQLSARLPVNCMGVGGLSLSMIVFRSGILSLDVSCEVEDVPCEVDDVGGSTDCASATLLHLFSSRSSLSLSLLSFRSEERRVR